MDNRHIGRVILGDEQAGLKSADALDQQKIDRDLSADFKPYPKMQRGIKNKMCVSSQGTFEGKKASTLCVAPSKRDGWWINRTDLPESLATKVSARNVWTTGDVVSNIVLRSGSPHNYLRMVEHIIALKLGMGIDNLMIDIGSGDPPLFDRGSMDLVETIEEAEIIELDKPVKHFTVKEKVTAIDQYGGFLTLDPCEGEPRLDIDAAIDFKTAIGQQRIVFPMSYDHFRYGAIARTNASAGAKLYCQTVGRIFADVRNLGYTNNNLLVAGKKRYVNEPRLEHDGKALEAVWHRSTLDLLAALALVEEGRFVGKVTSYKAGHRLDVAAVTKLYQDNLLCPYQA